MENDVFTLAKNYASNGWRVLPLYEPVIDGCSCGKPDCTKIGKHPRISQWQYDASSDLAVVGDWWKQWPAANIGLLLNDLAVLDVDPRHGGFESLATLEKNHGTLDVRARQRSGSGGWHYLFAADEGATMARGFRPGLDLLTGTGCFIVVAPSLHANGDRYEWTDAPTPLSTRRDQIDLYLPPLWLINVAAGRAAPNKGQSKRRGFILPETIAEGQRDITLTRYAGTLRRAGVNKEGILSALQIENQNRCVPPMQDADLKRIAGSIGTKEAGAEPPADGLIQRMAGTITASGAFARDAGGLLYHFEDGVYKPTGKRVIEKQVKRLCEEQAPKSWTPELANRIEAWILVDCPELWERPPLDVLNCRNGLLNVVSRTLLPHSPDHLSAVQIAASFDADARCPQIDRFVSEVFPGDTQHLPAEIVAWLMLPDTSIQKAVLLLGEGANGKSVWLNLLLTFLGRENVSTLSLHRIESDKFSAARLVGKLCNIGTDLPTAALASTSLFKALTGSDTITAERKFEASFEFTPFVRLLFSANSAPRSDDATHAFFRRWLCVPFDKTFSETDPNTVPRAILDARLSSPGELSGMLNNALGALGAVRRGKFTESDSTRAALDEFRRTTDPLAVWLDQGTVERPDAVVPKDRLRHAYGIVCQDAGRPIMPESQFTAALMRLRPKVQPTQRRINGKSTRVFLGLGFTTMESSPGGLF